MVILYHQPDGNYKFDFKVPESLHFINRWSENTGSRAGRHLKCTRASDWCSRSCRQVSRLKGYGEERLSPNWINGGGKVSTEVAEAAAARL